MRSYLALLLAALLAGACGGTSPTSPSGTGTPLLQTLESSAFVFHFASTDTVDAGWQEQFHAWAIAQLQVSPTRRITYNKYMNRSHMGDLIGNYSTNGFAQPGGCDSDGTSSRRTGNDGVRLGVARAAALHRRTGPRRAAHRHRSRALDDRTGARRGATARCADI
jgi:hypothetical protein